MTIARLRPSHDSGREPQERGLLPTGRLLARRGPRPNGSRADGLETWWRAWPWRAQHPSARVNGLLVEIESESESKREPCTEVALRNPHLPAGNQGRRDEVVVSRLNCREPASVLACHKTRRFWGAWESSMPNSSRCLIAHHRRRPPPPGHLGQDSCATSLRSQ